MNLQAIARALGGTVNGLQVLAPGPGHSKSDRSLAVFIDPYSPDLFRVHSHAGDDWRVCRDYVKARLGITDTPFMPQRRDVPRVAVADPNDDKARTIARSRSGARPAASRATPAMTYLASAG